MRMRIVSENPSLQTNLYQYASNNPINRIDPNGLFNILLGGGVSAAAPTGFDLSGGVVINPGLFGQRADVGVFGSAGGGVGVNVSADAFIGFVRGGMENVNGVTANYNVTLGPISVTILTDPKTGSFMGVTGGLGPAATLAGASGSLTYTGTLTARDVFSSARGCGK